MIFHRYDIIEAELKIRDNSGSIQKKKRPYVIVSNEMGTKNSTIITVMPLTHIIKKTYMPVHECLEVESDNGLSVYSMILGEQPQTISKDEVKRKIGTITNGNQKNMINKVCFNSFGIIAETRILSLDICPLGILPPLVIVCCVKLIIT